MESSHEETLTADILWVSETATADREHVNTKVRAEHDVELQTPHCKGLCQDIFGEGTDTCKATISDDDYSTFADLAKLLRSVVHDGLPTEVPAYMLRGSCGGRLCVVILRIAMIMNPMVPIFATFRHVEQVLGGTAIRLRLESPLEDLASHKVLANLLTPHFRGEPFSLHKLEYSVEELNMIRVNAIRDITLDILSKKRSKRAQQCPVSRVLFKKPKRAARPRSQGSMPRRRRNIEVRRGGERSEDAEFSSDDAAAEVAEVVETEAGNDREAEAEAIPLSALELPADIAEEWEQAAVEQEQPAVFFDPASKYVHSGNDKSGKVIGRITLVRVNTPSEAISCYCRLHQCGKITRVIQAPHHADLLQWYAAGLDCASKAEHLALFPRTRCD
eukprot:6492744-Amphidinium_carterae.1